MDTTETLPNVESRTFHLGISVEPRAMQDDAGKTYYEFEISNEMVDSHGTVFKMAGAKLDAFNADPIVTYGHPSFDSTDPDDIIGTGPAMIVDGRLIARYYPEQGDMNQKAAKVVHKLDQNLIKSASIVASYQDYRMGKRDMGEDPSILYFTDWELVMWGIVMKGSNPNAKKRTIQRVAEIKGTITPIDDLAETAIQETISRQSIEVLLTEQRLRLLAIHSGTVAQH